ncbi:hypothetical protein F2Q69_00053628 [Brassica cretica]|uniref:Uncharacterized protein n=1 Tax=Brassica cretica TaxID=69181 RepID=A0A8S9N712_BRACR|nr:hypothetical protein F2Q69_00053628 [Brassica cretica]
MSPLHSVLQEPETEQRVTHETAATEPLASSRLPAISASSPASDLDRTVVPAPTTGSLDSPVEPTQPAPVAPEQSAHLPDSTLPTNTDTKQTSDTTIDQTKMPALVDDEIPPTATEPLPAQASVTPAADLQLSPPTSPIHELGRGLRTKNIPAKLQDYVLQTITPFVSSSSERASLFEESHLCLPEHATSFTPTKLAPEIYTKDEFNEMATGICGAEEKLGDELKTLVDDTYQPLDRGYNEVFRSMVEMRKKIESMQHILEKEATTSPSIDAKPQTSQIPAEPESLAEKKDEWKIAYLNTKINDQDLDTICKKDPQPSTSIDICTIKSIDRKFAAMEDRDIGKLNDQHDFHEEGSTSIDRFRRASLDVRKPTEHLPYTAAEVD